MKLTVHMIAQAHLDPVWLWRWTEGRAEALATSQSAADRLAEYPSLHFTRGESQIYEWIEQENPALFARIKHYIQEGRWHVVNGMLIQPDMNIPSGESIVRQALLGKTYFQHTFGLDVRVAYCVDTFGHAGTLPQILKKCGFDHYVFMRPQEHEKNLPPQAFWWQSPDGTRLLTFRISHSYGTWGPDVWPFIEHALHDRPADLQDVMCFFGVGNHGGGPTRQQIEQVLALDTEHADLDIRFSSIPAYFESIRPQVDTLPVVQDELQFHAVGCYSVNSRLKRLHRQAESGLLIAERLAALAEIWAGQSPDRESFQRLWRDLCFNQFHDILGGTCIKEAQDESEMALARVVMSAQELANTAGRLVGAQVNTSGAGGTVILFNPFSYPLESYVEYEPWTGWERWAANGWGLVDDLGAPVVCQPVEAQPAVSLTDQHGFDRLVFKVFLPPLGYRVYRFDHGLPCVQPQQGVWVRPDGLENEHLSIQMDPQTGNIVSCRDKQTGLELVGTGGWNVPQVLDDPSDTWSHAVRSYDQLLGQFGSPVIQVIDQGPLQASLRVERTWEDASGARGTWTQQIILRAGDQEFLLRNWLHWQGGWRTLKLAFDAALSAPQGVRDVAFGAMPFPNDGMETPLHMWAAVTGSRPGLAVINDGKYGCDLSGSTLRLTILRSPPYAYHVPHVIGSKQRYDWIDQGLQEFTLAVRPFTGSWQAAGVVQRARELNLPVQAVTMHAHPGVLSPSLSLCSLDSPELELTALKPAEDGDGYILRIADRHGLGGAGILAWQGQEFALVCKPSEVKTLRVLKSESGWNFMEVSMTEQIDQAVDSF